MCNQIGSVGVTQLSTQSRCEWSARECVCGGRGRHAAPAGGGERVADGEAPAVHIQARPQAPVWYQKQHGNIPPHSKNSNQRGGNRTN